jgi:hypothetical protein
MKSGIVVKIALETRVWVTMTVPYQGNVAVQILSVKNVEHLVSLAQIASMVQYVVIDPPLVTTDVLYTAK